MGTDGSHHSGADPIPPSTIAKATKTAKTEAAIKCPVSRTDLVYLNDAIEEKIATPTSNTMTLARVDPSQW
jgi:hypothetical protein